MWMNEPGVKRRKISKVKQEEHEGGGVEDDSCMDIVTIVRKRLEQQNSSSFKRVNQDLKTRANYKSKLKQRILTQWREEKREEEAESVSSAIENAAFFALFVHDRDQYHELMTCLTLYWTTRIGTKPSAIVALDVRDVIGLEIDPYVQEDEQSRAIQEDIGKQIEEIFKVAKKDNATICPFCKAVGTLTPLPSIQLRSGDEGVTHFSLCGNCNRKVRTAG